MSEFELGNKYQPCFEYTQTIPSFLNDFKFFKFFSFHFKKLHTTVGVTQVSLVKVPGHKVLAEIRPKFLKVRTKFAGFFKILIDIHKKSPGRIFGEF